MTAGAIALLLFASPSKNNYADAYQSGRDIGIVVRYFAVIYIAAFFIFRKRSREMKDKVTLAIGSIFLIYSLSTAGVTQLSSGSSNTQVIERTLISKTEAIRMKHIKTMLPIFEKVKTLKLANAISLNTLANQNDIRTYKTKLVEYLKLVDERELAADSFISEGQAVLQSAEYKSIVNSDAYKLTDSYWKRERVIEKDWARIQRESTAAFNGILILVDSNFKDVEISDGAIAFASQKQIDAYEKQMSIIKKLQPQEQSLAADMKKMDKEFDIYVDSILSKK